MIKLKKITEINTNKKALIISKFDFELKNCRVLKKENLFDMDFMQIKDVLELYPEYKQVILFEDTITSNKCNYWIKNLEKKYPTVLFAILEKGGNKNDC